MCIRDSLGTEAEPFLIKDTNDFTSFVKYHPEAHYLQRDDLNLSGVTAPSGAVIGGTFKGVYDGGSYKITGLTLNNLDVYKRQRHNRADSESENFLISA